MKKYKNHFWLEWQFNGIEMADGSCNITRNSFQHIADYQPIANCDGLGFEKIVSFIEKKDEGRFYKVKCVKYLWQPEAVLLHLKIFNEFWQHQVISSLQTSSCVNVEKGEPLNDDNDDHISNDADSYQDPEETLENIEQTNELSIENVVYPSNIQPPPTTSAGNIYSNTNLDLISTENLNSSLNNNFNPADNPVLNEHKFTSNKTNFTNEQIEYVNNENVFTNVNENFTKVDTKFTNLEQRIVHDNACEFEKNEQNFVIDESTFSNSNADILSNQQNFTNHGENFTSVTQPNNFITEQTVFDINTAFSNNNEIIVSQLAAVSTPISATQNDIVDIPQLPVVTLNNTVKRKPKVTETKQKEDCSKGFSCEVCSKIFSRRTTLQRHMLIHTGDKPWHCNYCEKAFNQKSILNRHLLTHSDAKLFSCNICQLSFTEKGAVTRHIAAIHNKQEKNWVCDVCDKKFIIKEYLTKHKFLHSDKKPYQCGICKSSFADSSAFRRHERTHKSNVFSCFVCDIQCKNPVSFKRHIKRCKKSISKCYICNISFDKNNKYEEHFTFHSSTNHNCERCNISFQDYFAFNEHLLIHSKKDMDNNRPIDIDNSHDKNVSKKLLLDSDFESGLDANLLKDSNENLSCIKVPKSFDELFKTALIQ